MPRFYFSDAYKDRLTEIEDHLLATGGFQSVANFTAEHDEILVFIGANSTIPPKTKETGDQSWPLNEGRYRVFFITLTQIQSKDTVIVMTNIIDNKQANLEFYPSNSLPTFDE